MEYITIENISKIVAVIMSIIALFVSLKKFLSKKEALKIDYEFAEKFIAEDKWKNMNDYLLERAYQALSGKHLDASIIRFFLNQNDPSKKLFDYHRGAKFLNPILEESKIVKISLIDSLKDEMKFKWARGKQLFLYGIGAFMALIPLFIFLKTPSYDIILFIGLWVFSFGIFAVNALEKNIALESAKRISEL